MKIELVFATNNKHKLEEISKLLGDSFKLLSLSDIGCFDNIPEDQDTLEGNAFQKAKYVYDRFHKNCFADDTGLEVNALNGKPGVHSARYSEPDFPNLSGEKRSKANISKLLKELGDSNDRNAAFRTIICLIKNGNNYFFEGKVCGKIITLERGSHGFGYDPVFVPEGYENTYAEISLQEKNKISHRAKAITKLIDFLSKQLDK